ncbi:hypothetical protein CSKR_114412, partial [Clonorchis sinensis]
LQTIGQGSTTLICILFTERNIHLILERVLLNFPGYSLTVTQMQANVTKRLHKFRNRSRFPRDAKRIYEKTYYSHASPVLYAVAPLDASRATGLWKPPLSGTFENQKGVTISNKEETLDRGTKYFKQQLSCPPGHNPLELTNDVEPWPMNVEPPFVSEVYDCIFCLNRHEASFPGDILTTLFKDGGRVLSQQLFDLFACTWGKETLLEN